MREYARGGEVIAYRDLAAQVGGGRRELVDALDRINAKTCRNSGILLSAVVVGNNGMPDSGFFEKFKSRQKNGEWLWPLKRWEGLDRESVDPEIIFRVELAAVYKFYDAPIRAHVFIDLENSEGWPNARKALLWLRDRGCRLSGVACTKSKYEFEEARVWLEDEEKEIKFLRVPKVGPKGQEADAAILVEYARSTHQVTTRDFVCFIAGKDRIYKTLTGMALREGMRVLRFCTGEDTVNWKPDDKGFYRAFDLAASEAEWDAHMGWTVGE